MEKIEFRKCKPTDVDKAVPLILSSGPDAFSYVFSNDKKSASNFLRYAFQRKGGEFSYDNHYGLILNEELIGIGAVFNSHHANDFTKKDFLNILNFYKMNSLAVLIRGLRTEQIIKLPKKNEICIAHLGISPNYQGQGLGKKLISFLMGQLSLEKSDYFILDVSEHNPRAKFLYERLGFKVAKCEYSKLKNNFGYVANHFRMKHCKTLSNNTII